MSVLAIAPKDDTGFEAWENQICHTFVPLRARRARDASGFSGQVGSTLLGSVVLADVAASHAQIERTPRLIRSGDPELYKFGLQTSGTCVIEQEERQAHLGPGDLALYDTSRPYRITFSDDFRMTVAMFPRSLVQLPEKQLTSLTAVRLAGDSRLGGLVASLMRSLNTPAPGALPVTATHLGDAIVDLITATFAHQLQQPLDPGSPEAHRTLVGHVRRFVDENLQDPELTSRAVADAHFVSVRYLQKVFEAEGTSVSTLIRTRRLERCRRDLADPGRGHLSIAQVGHRWGFPDAAHFSRLFRATYGRSPREFRKLAVRG